MVLRSDIQGIIFDFDNTLYENPPNKDDVFAQAIAQAVIKLGFPGTQAEAVEKALHSYKTHGSEIAVFEKDYGMDERAVFLGQHSAGAPLMAQAIAPRPSLTDSFNKLSGHYELLVLTHGTQEWADQLLAHLELSPALKSTHILGLDHPAVGYKRKNDGVEAFQIAADVMGLPLKNLAVIEDSMGNLLHPHKAGMQTVYVNWGKPAQKLPEHVHVQVETITNLVPKP